MKAGTGHKSCLHDGQVFGDARRRLGVSQYQLSQRTGLTRSLIAAIESGRVALRGEKCFRLWGALADVEAAHAAAPPLPRLSSFGRPSAPGARNAYVTESEQKELEQRLSEENSVSATIRKQAERIRELSAEVADLRALFKAAELEALSSAKIRELDERLSDTTDEDDDDH